MMPKGYWLKGKPPKRNSFTLSTSAKEATSIWFTQIIEDFKNKYMPDSPNKSN